MSDRVERRIRELTVELRRQDRASAPGFDELLQSALEQPRSRHPWRRLWPVPVAAAAALLLLVLLTPWPRTTHPQSELAEAGELAQWRAPSTSFLGLGNELLGETGPPDNDTMLTGGWVLPSDTLMQQADETFGQEM